MSILTESKARKVTGGPLPDQGGGEEEMSFLDHLEELRWHMIRSGAAILLSAIAIFAIGKPVFEYVILAPKEAGFVTYRVICSLSEYLCFYPPEFQLETRQLGEQFLVHLKTSLMLGLVVVFPYVFWEFWKFIRPGLYPQERKAIRGVVLITTFLFYLGVCFGYFIIAPFAVTFLAGYDIGAVSAPTLASYTNYLTMFTLPTGLVFQLPIVVYFLSKLGLVTPAFLRTYRRHAFVVFLVLSAIITPPDMITQLLIAIPLYGLYEVSISISARIERKHKESFG